MLIWDGLGSENKGGLHSFISNLKKALESQDINPAIVNYRQAKASRHFLHPLNYPLFNKKPFYLAKMSNLFFDLISERTDSNPIVFHGLCNFNLPGTLGGYPNKINYIKREYPVKFVLTVHDIIPILAPKKVSYANYLTYSKFVRRALAVADRVHCVSDWTRRSIIELFPWADSKISVVHNGVGFDEDLKEFPNALEKAFRRCFGSRLHGELISNSQKTILFVSRYERYKGFDFAARLFKHLLKKKNFKIHVVTDKRGRDFFKSRLSINPGHAISLHTNISTSSLKGLYASADFTILPSLLEGFGLPAGEALMHGSIPIFFEHTAMAEWVPSPLAINMPMASSPSDWLDAMNSYERANPENNDQIKAIALPTWNAAAAEIASLYRSLGI